MFYYAKGPQMMLNFTLIDRSMRIVEFSTPFIDSYHKDHPDEFSAFEKFEKIVFSEEQEGEAVDLFNNEELSSDEDERPDFEEKTIKELRDSVYDLLDKDITKLAEDIERKGDEMMGEGQRDATSTKFKKL